MSDPRPDSDPPPRVEVTLPDGRTIPGRIQGWQQGTDGRWWARVTIQLPAGAVHQVDGEDYTGVPRETAGPRYVLATDTRAKPDGTPAMTLHRADCWLLDDAAAWIRITPCADASQASGALRFDDTVACDICHPSP